MTFAIVSHPTRLQISFVKVIVLIKVIKVSFTQHPALLTIQTLTIQSAVKLNHTLFTISHEEIVNTTNVIALFGAWA